MVVLYPAVNHDFADTHDGTTRSEFKLSLRSSDVEERFMAGRSSARGLWASGLNSKFSLTSTISLFIPHQGDIVHPALTC